MLTQACRDINASKSQRATVDKTGGRQRRGQRERHEVTLVSRCGQAPALARLSDVCRVGTRACTRVDSHGCLMALDVAPATSPAHPA